MARDACGSGERAGEPPLAVALDASVARALVPLSGALAALLFVFGATNLVLVPPPQRLPLLALDAAVGAILLAFYLVTRRGGLPPRRAQMTAGLVALLLVGDVLVSLFIRQEPSGLAFLAAIVLGAGSVLLSARWLAVVVAAAVAGWTAAASRFLPLLDVLDVGRSLVGASVAAALILVVRVRLHLRVEELRRRDTAQVRALEAATAELERREARFRALVQNAYDLVTVLDRDGVIRYESAASERILGHAPHERVGTPVVDVVHPEDAERVSRALAEVAATPGATLCVEARVRHADGSWRLVESTGTNLLDHPAVGGIVVNTRDVTERRRVEAALRRSEKLSALGTLVAGVAHEMNNPLAFMGTSAEASRLSLARVVADPATPPALVPALEKVLRSEERVLEGVRRISRISAGLTRVARTGDGRGASPLDAAALFDVALTVASPRMRGREVEVRKEYAAARRVLASEDELTQVLLNLLLNACDAMQEQDAGVLTLRTLDEGGFVVFEVADTGRGMGPEEQERALAPFFTTKPTGTGLGLSISHRIVLDHGGRLGFTSEPGRGTTFRVELPAAE